MLSIEKCYELLNKNRKRYTIEETKEIRKSLYQIADIIYESKQLEGLSNELFECILE